MAKSGTALQRLAQEALDLGFGCFSDGDHVPFAMVTAKNGRRTLVNFPSAGGIINAVHLKVVREIVRKTFSTARRYALVWDGHLKGEGVKQDEDAVVAEVTEPGSGQTTIFVQRYRQMNRTKTLEKVGEAVTGQYSESLLKEGKRRTGKRTHGAKKHRSQKGTKPP